MENKNILFINPEIMNNTIQGENTVRTIVATSGREGVIGNYYFDNDSIPLSLFPVNTEYLGTQQPSIHLCII